MHASGRLDPWIRSGDSCIVLLLIGLFAGNSIGRLRSGCLYGAGWGL